MELGGEDGEGEAAEGEAACEDDPAVHPVDEGGEGEGPHCSGGVCAQR